MAYGYRSDGVSLARLMALDAEERIKFEARIYEKAEHWSFDTTVDAKSEEEARKILLRDYPKSSYTIQSIHRA